jgi:hypothetical protein
MDFRDYIIRNIIEFFNGLGINPILGIALIFILINHFAEQVSLFLLRRRI